MQTLRQLANFFSNQVQSTCVCIVMTTTYDTDAARYNQLRAIITDVQNGCFCLAKPVVKFRG